jgi:hypothetical protein
MDIQPKIPKRIPIVEAAIAAGKYQICPDNDPDFPQVHEPMHNPNRDDQVAKWVPSQFSFQMPDGGTFFCELLQNGDPANAWDTTLPDDITEEDF